MNYIDNVVWSMLSVVVYTRATNLISIIINREIIDEKCVRSIYREQHKEKDRPSKKKREKSDDNQTCLQFPDNGGKKM